MRALVLMALLTLLAMAALRYFVTCRVTDRGGMENPDFTLTREIPAQ